jgi:hypothetical protein
MQSVKTISSAAHFYQLCVIVVAFVAGVVVAFVMTGVVVAFVMAVVIVAVLSMLLLLLLVLSAGL